MLLATSDPPAAVVEAPERELLRRRRLARVAHPPPVAVQPAAARGDPHDDAGDERPGIGNRGGWPAGGREEPVGPADVVGDGVGVGVTVGVGVGPPAGC